MSVSEPNPNSFTSASLTECSNVPIAPKISCGNVYVKIPVVLAEVKVQIDMEAIISFPERVLEIKDVKKRLKLVQCRLLLPTNKLFLKGYVRKNVQYATPTSSTATAVASSLHSLTIDVPFQCVTPLDYLTPPVLPVQNRRDEFEFFTATPLPSGFPSKESLLSGDLSQFDQISEEFFNELPYCELISAQYTEFDEALNRDRTEVAGAPFEEGTFAVMEEKMVVDLTLKVLQNQQLRIHSGLPVKEEEEEDGDIDFED